MIHDCNENIRKLYFRLVRRVSPSLLDELHCRKLLSLARFFLCYNNI